MLNIFSKLLDTNQREIERLEKIVSKINNLESQAKKLNDADFAKKTEFFKEDIAKGKTLEEILPDAFALVREAAWRVLGQRHFDVQMMAAIALFEGKVAEQRTGEGKTLTASAPLYL